MLLLKASIKKSVSHCVIQVFLLSKLLFLIPVMMNLKLSVEKHTFGIVFIDCVKKVFNF